MSIQSMDDEDLIRMVGDELHRHNDDTPFMEALDELLRRVSVMRDFCEAAEPMAFGYETFPYYVLDSASHEARFDLTQKSYRALRDRNSVTTNTQPSNTTDLPAR